jgi:Family of unknown function (DUF5670)
MTVRHDIRHPGRETADERPAPARIAAALKGQQVMLWTILVILLVLWLLGLIGSVGGAAIHLLLVLALIVIVVQFLGRRSSTG